MLFSYLGITWFFHKLFRNFFSDSTRANFRNSSNDVYILDLFRYSSGIYFRNFFMDSNTKFPKKSFSVVSRDSFFRNLLQEIHEYYYAFLNYFDFWSCNYRRFQSILQEFIIETNHSTVLKETPLTIFLSRSTSPVCQSGIFIWIFLKTHPHLP